MSFSLIKFQQMKLKILYTFDRDESITCLTRSTKSTSVIIPPKNKEIGVINLRTCINCLIAASPEIVAGADSYDFVVYSTDFSEPGLPQVSHGLLSWMLVLGDDVEQDDIYGKYNNGVRNGYIPSSSDNSDKVDDGDKVADKITATTCAPAIDRGRTCAENIQKENSPIEYEEQFTKMQDNKHNYMITGKICDNILASSTSDDSSILEIRLRLKPVSSTTQADFIRSMDMYTQLSSVISKDKSSQDFDPKVWSDWISSQTRLMSLLQQQKILDRQARLTKKQETWSTRSGYRGFSNKSGNFNSEGQNKSSNFNLEGQNIYSEPNNPIDSDEPYVNISSESNFYVPPSSPPMNASQLFPTERNVSSSRKLKLPNDFTQESSPKRPQRSVVSTSSSSSQMNSINRASPAPFFSIKEMIKKMDKEKLKANSPVVPASTPAPTPPNAINNPTERVSHDGLNNNAIAAANIIQKTPATPASTLPDLKLVSSSAEDVLMQNVNISTAKDGPANNLPNNENLPVSTDSYKPLVYDQEINITAVQSQGKKLPKNTTSKINRERFAKRKDIIALELYEDMKAGRTPKYCENCGAIHTSTWRRAKHKLFDKTKVLDRKVDVKKETTKKNIPEKDYLLCNPCGIYLREKKEMRPESLWDPKKGVDALASILQQVHETLKVEGSYDDTFGLMNEANISSIIASVKLIQRGSTTNPLSLKRSVTKLNTDSTVKRIKSLPVLINVPVDDNLSVNLDPPLAVSNNKLVGSIFSEPNTTVNQNFEHSDSNMKYDVNFESSYSTFASSPPSKSRHASINGYSSELKENLKPIMEDYFQTNGGLDSLFNTPKSGRSKDVNTKASDNFSPSNWLSRDLFSNESKFLHNNIEGNTDICALLSDVFTSPGGDDRHESYFSSGTRLPTINDDDEPQLQDIPSSPLLTSYRNNMLSNTSEPASMLSSVDSRLDMWSDLQNTSPPKIVSCGLTTIDSQKKMKLDPSLQLTYYNGEETHN